MHLISLAPGDGYCYESLVPTVAPRNVTGRILSLLLTSCVARRCNLRPRLHAEAVIAAAAAAAAVTIHSKPTLATVSASASCSWERVFSVSLSLSLSLVNNCALLPASQAGKITALSKVKSSPTARYLILASHSCQQECNTAQLAKSLQLDHYLARQDITQPCRFLPKLP